jgi:hypothetical protein
MVVVVVEVVVVVVSRIAVAVAVDLYGRCGSGGVVVVPVPCTRKSCAVVLQPAKSAVARWSNFQGADHCQASNTPLTRFEF